MKCRKCNNELSQDSKFCNMCGTERESNTLELTEQIVNYSKRMFFLFGLIHGISTEQKEEEKLRKIYKEIKNNSEFSEEIKEVVDYWNEVFKGK